MGTSRRASETTSVIAHGQPRRTLGTVKQRMRPQVELARLVMVKPGRGRLLRPPGVGEQMDGAQGRGDRLPENLRSADVYFADWWLVPFLVHSDVLYRAPGTQDADAQKELPQCAYCVLQARI